MRQVVCLLVCVFASVAGSEAATRTVCASGCQYSKLQTAINEAVPGDTILLRAGEAYVGNYTLKVKSGSAFITIKSDAPATSLPPDGVRLVPQGKPGANTQRSALARLIGQGSTYRSLPVIQTEPGAHHYRLQFLEIDGTGNVGYGTLVRIGDNDSSQTTDASVPYGIVLDRIWVHGHASKGVRRGVAVNGRSVDVLNSYIDDIFSLADSQAIASYNTPGPVRIINNFLEASGENVMVGGADPRIRNLVPSDFEIRGNHFYKDPAWKNGIVKTPSTPSVGARTGGSLAAGKHYFKVAALMTTSGDTVVSMPSTEASVTVGAKGAVALSWPSVSGADKYRVYRGTSAGSQSVYLDTSTTAPSMTYTGAGEKSGSPKTSATKWTYKNHLELKNAQRVTIDGNLFENNWSGFQNGYAILFTPKNQEQTAPWTVVRDVVFSNNIVRHSSMGINISGRDWESSTQQARNIKILNNVFEDISKTYGNKGAFLLIAAGPADIVVDHNTIVHDGAVLEVEGPKIPGFVYTNNFSRHNQYGVKGNKRAVGTDSLNEYFTGGVFRGNVLAGGPASSYPTGNHFPTLAEFATSFLNAAAGDYTLAAASPFINKATDGRDIGVDTVALRLGQAAQVTTAGSSEPPIPGPTPTPQPPPPDVLPEGWQAEDVGAVGEAGSASASGGVFVVQGAGADVWGTADAFHFAYRPLSGDGTIVARIASLAGTEAWTKVGVMIRTGTDAGSAHAFMLASAGKGLAFQRRKSSGASSLSTPGGSGTAPRWVKLTRAGNVITASSSTNGTSWTLVGSDTFTMPADVLVGLASHGHGSLATATFDEVSVSSGQGLPAGWEATDIGSVGKAGSASHDAGTFTVKGAGADIWGSADALHYAWRTLAGDGEIVARVASVSGSQAWTKAGVMMRQALDAGSTQALMLVSTGKGVSFQRRPVTGGTSLSTSGGAGTAPEWVKLTRAGQVITASVSSDGAVWRVVGSDTFSMVGTIHVGLAVSSHTVSALATGTFDDVTVTDR